MNEAIGQVISLGVAVAVSPPPVIAMVLLLATPRARANGFAFLLGWLSGLIVAGAIILLVSDEAGATDGSEPATWVSLLKLALGLLLLALAVKQWRGRPRSREEAELPQWMATISAFRPRKALVTGALLSGANPKNLLLIAGASAAIAETGIGSSQQAIALAVFIAVGTLGVGVPLALHTVLGERSRRPLDELRSWMAANNSVIMTMITLVIGATLLGDGISGL